jgi:pyruvate dehydrogenase E2 component (dihydrolipoamide acetyltransferase)
MTVDLLMPKLGLTMTEGVLLEWKVAPGDRFAKGDILFVVETDKAATDIEAEADGRLAERLVEEGATVPVGQSVGRLSGEAGPAVTAAVGGRADAVPRAAGQETRAVAALPSPPPIAAPPAVSPVPAVPARIVATPLARRMARAGGVDLAAIAGSGPRGRIKAIDVERAAASRAAKAASVPPVAAATPGAQPLRSRPTPTQAAMARRLSAVKQGVPHFYLSTEVEVSALLELRAGLNADASWPKLTLTHFILAAVGRALGAHPGINRVWDEGEIVAYAATDVSLAVETDGGLYVPVVRNCGGDSLDRIAAAARAAVDRARIGRLSAADMEGAAIAVSNAGMHDVTWLTPIINPGQSAILGVGSVRELFRPDAAGSPALRREMGLVFSGDHRVHTGVEGLAFLNSLKALLETPVRLLKRG